MSPLRWKLLPSILIAALVALGISVAASVARAGASVQSNAAAAVSYANQHGYRSSIGVLDTQTGSFSGAGDYDSAYASESVMKVFIATRLLLTGQMSGWNETTAYKMITQSDDASANALYGRAGGDGVITWIKQTLNIPNLGSPPLRPGWWGGTQINARGMTAFYNAIRHRPVVWNWLGNAMHHATVRGSDGTYQFFGLPSATPTPAIKQGWGGDNAAGQPAFNSTGFVNGDRYAVVILTQGGTYGTPIANMLTAEARLLMPGGKISNDDPTGTVDSVTATANYVTIRGWAYDPNAPRNPVKIVVYDNGKLAAYGPTSSPRPDVNAVFKLTGSHGYALTMKLADGPHSVCAYATNIGAGTNVQLGCKSAPLTGAPAGVVQPVSLRANVATVSGWAYDYDATAQPIKVVVNVAGKLAAYGMTTVNRPDVNAVMHVSGVHGYQFAVRLPDGVSHLCVYGVNGAGAGGNTQLGCQNVGISGAPIGSFDSATVHSGVASVTGWTFDYDQPAAQIRTVIYLNGKLAAYGPTTSPRKDVNTAYGVTGEHGYSFSIQVSAGQNQLCAYGINAAGAGGNTDLGCRSVTG